jgi:FtsH-binding integral membrane protein
MDRSSMLAQAGAQALQEVRKAFMVKVYGWMVAGLFITALMAGFAASDTDLIYSLLNIRWGLIIAEFALVFALSAFIDKMSALAATISFLVYSALNGLTLSALVIVYSPEAILNAFVTSAGMFGIMAVFGAITKRDLSGWGSFFLMGLIGIILAGLVNVFLASSAISFAISVLGVLVFTGLTAYDSQKIKESAELEFQGSEIATKGAIMGALTLYLDFINLFLFIVRLLGGRRD